MRVVREKGQNEKSRVGEFGRKREEGPGGPTNGPVLNPGGKSRELLTESLNLNLPAAWCFVWLANVYLGIGCLRASVVFIYARIEEEKRGRDRRG
ncbi:hypothetical protein MRX96_042359 [Rhipicephalus microplus]